MTENNNWYDKNKVIASMLQIVNDLYIRAGKEEYARNNDSYGISSLEKKHATIKNDSLILKFPAKSN